MRHCSAVGRCHRCLCSFRPSVRPQSRYYYLFQISDPCHVEVDHAFLNGASQPIGVVAPWGVSLDPMPPAKAALAVSLMREVGDFVSTEALKAHTALSITEDEWVEFWAEAGQRQKAAIAHMQRGQKAQAPWADIRKVADKAAAGRITAARIALITRDLGKGT